MAKNEKICELFRDTYSIDYVLEQIPNVNVDEVIQVLITEGLITSIPKKHYNAGVLTYVVANIDLIPRITEMLAEGCSRNAIFTKLHIGHTRLQKIIEEYNLLSEVKSDVTETTTDNSNKQEESISEDNTVSCETVNQAETLIADNDTVDVKESDRTKGISDEEILAYAKEHLALGETRTQIYTELHIGHRRLEKILAKSGIETRKKGKVDSVDTVIEKQETPSAESATILEVATTEQLEKEQTVETESVDTKAVELKSVDTKAVESSELSTAKKKATVHDFTKKENSVPKSKLDELRAMLGSTMSLGYDIILVERPKPSVVEPTDAELREQIQAKLKKGMPKKAICQDLHIGLARLNSLVETEGRFEITSMLIAQYQLCKHKGYSDKYTAEELALTMTQLKAVADLLNKTKVSKSVSDDKEHIPTVEEKVVYANKTYGVGSWRFLTRQECLDMLLQDSVGADTVEDTDFSSDSDELLEDFDY